MWKICHSPLKINMMIIVLSTLSWIPVVILCVCVIDSSSLPQKRNNWQISKLVLVVVYFILLKLRTLIQSHLVVFRPFIQHRIEFSWFEWLRKRNEYIFDNDRLIYRFRCIIVSIQFRWKFSCAKLQGICKHCWCMLSYKIKGRWTYLSAAIGVFSVFYFPMNHSMYSIMFFFS